jgi:SAM-dependent methyltransferase
MISTLRKIRRKIMPMWTDLWPEICAEPSHGRVVQLGSGFATRIPGAIHVDIASDTNPDIIFDLNNTPYPFPDNSVNVIVAISILEHLSNFLGAMAEIHRIAKPGASVYILVPHFSSAASFVDPTHCQHLSARSCDYFICGTDLESKYGFYTPFRFNLVRRYVELAGVLKYIPPLRWLANSRSAFWEDYLCYIIRGSGIFWELTAKK